MINSLLKKLQKASNFQIFAFTVAFSIILTMIVVLTMSIFFFGKITLEFMATGLVASFLVAGIVTAILVPLVRRLGQKEGEDIGELLAKERDRSKKALQKSEESLARAQTIAHIGSWDWNPTTGSVVWSDEHYRIFGLEPQEVTATHDLFTKYLHPDDIGFVNKSLEDALASKKEYCIDYRIIRKDGAERVCHGHAAVQYDDDGNLERMIGTIQDITERKKAEEKAGKLEKTLSSILERTHDVFYRVDTEGKFIWVSPVVKEMTGYEPTELIGENIAGFYLNMADREKFKQKLHSSGGMIRKFEAPLKRKDGSIFWVSTDAGFFYDKAGNVGGVEGATRDITERKLAEAELKQSEGKYRTLIDHMQDGVFLIQDGKFLFANEPIADMTGYSVEELTGKRFDSFIAPEDREMVLDRYTRRLHGEDVPAEYEFRLLHKDGITAVYINMAVGITLYEGKTTSIGTIKNTTEKKKAEEERLKAQKLESLSLLAGGIAHDFNNILTAILGNISLAKADEKLDDETKEILSEGITATRHAQDLTKQLLTFSKGGEPLKATVDIAKLLSGAVRFAMRGSHSSYTITISENLSYINADGGQISQVINNLVLNAEEAMPDGGRVTVNAFNMTIEPESKLPLKSGAYVCFSIEDTGIGIKAEHRARIFDPYFSSKKRGSGLGLATSYSIISNHSGHIEVESDLGKGTKFTICLPASKEAIPPAKPAKTEIKKGKGRILVMDDEQVIRDVLVRMLKKLGYEVDSSVDGNEALKKYGERLDNGSSYDLVIMDLTIPGGMGGLQTIKELLKLDQNAKAIVSSGYSTDAVMKDYRKYGFRGIMPKPFELEKLSEILAEVLSAE